MAGLYQDAPGHRHAYHRDGAVLFRVNPDASVTEFSSSVATDLNNELATAAAITLTTGFGNNVSYYVGLLFPELRSVNAISIGALTNTFWADSLYPRELQYSNDTTNGSDGTWVTAFSGQIGPHSTTRSGMRSSFTTISGVTSVKAIRFRSFFGRDPISIFHWFVYGPDGGGIVGNTDRLSIWQAGTDAEVGAAFLDWGDVPRGSTADKTFRIKNRSGTLTANNITVTSSSIDEPTPSFSGTHTFSLDGVNFSSSVVLTALAPGAISGVITIRKTTPSNAALHVWYAQMTAVAGSWT